ncbi:MAG: energy transducer TonB, partial [Acidobacteria bacterium]|nr:energy transducer TonB [Acidobacteriota bacterium]
PPPPPPPKGGMNIVKPANDLIVKTGMNLNFNQNLIMPVSHKVVLPSVNNGSDIGVEGGVEGGVAGGVVGGVVGGEIGGVLGGVLGGVKGGVLDPLSADIVAAPPPPPVQKVVEKKEIAPSPEPKIIRRSEGIIRGNATVRITPSYPMVARNAAIQGEVVVEIVIDENGNVISSQIISGHSLLQQTCLVTAKEWKFNPTLLNNKPVKVQGTLTFRFNL